MAELSQIKELLKNELTPIHTKLAVLEENFKQLTTSFEYLSAKYDHLLEQSIKYTNEKIAGLIKSTKTMQAEINSNKDMALKTMFLLYINDISNCSDKLNFRIFADDTNVFASYTRS